MKKLWTIACVAWLASAPLGCGSDEDAAGTDETSSEEAAAAPAEPEEPPQAGALGVPLAEVNEQVLRTSLEAGGWEVRSVSTSGSFLTILGMKDGTRARVSYQNPTNPSQRGYIEGDGGAVEVEGDVLLGVTVRDDPDTGRAMLDDMLDR